MPTGHSLGLNEDESFLPLWPELSQQDPEESIGIGGSRSRAMSRENRQLLPQRQIFQKQVSTRVQGL